MKPIVALLAAALVALFAAAPAFAAPVYEGSVSAAQTEFKWSGGPISGANLVGEPCGPSRQCEDTLLHVGDKGELKVHWTAEGPGDQGWLGVALYKSDGEGNPEGDAIVDGGAFDNEGAIVRPDLEPGDYIIRFSALLSAAATYDADATLKAGTDPLAGPKGPAKPDASGADWYERAGAEWRHAYIEEEDGTTLLRRHPPPQGHPGRPADAGDPLDRPVLQPLRPDRPRRPDAGHRLHAVRRGRPVGPLRRLHPRRRRDPQGLHGRAGRPARLRRQLGLPGLGRARRAGRRRRRRRVRGLAGRGRTARSACTASPTTASPG